MRSIGTFINFSFLSTIKVTKEFSQTLSLTTTTAGFFLFFGMNRLFLNVNYKEKVSVSLRSFWYRPIKMFTVL